MRRKRLFQIATCLVSVIFVVNFLANQFYWYYSVWYLDMVMHFAGGFWLGLIFAWLLPESELQSRTSILVLVLCGVILIGFGWEVFELYFNNYVAANPFNLLDTASDLFFDLSGGVLAIGCLYFVGSFGERNFKASTV